MARLARIVVPGLVHHVTQRGNHRQTVATLNRDISKQIRTSTRCGRPWGSNEFLTALELQLGGCLQPQKQGRKPSRTPESAKA